MSLNNVGIMLGDVGDRDGALQATREAIDTYRKLALSRPEAFLPDLAMSLNNVGIMGRRLPRNGKSRFGLFDPSHASWVVGSVAASKL